MSRRDKQDTIGWQAELLVKDILTRDELNTTVHNSMADADDPTVGISLFGRDFRYPLPDFCITRMGGTLFTSAIRAKTWHVEVKAKTCFGDFENGGFLTTGFENWTLECYQRFAEECGQLVEVYFVQIFPLAEAKGAVTFCDAAAGIYKADIQLLYESRWRPPFDTELAYWPIENGPLTLIHTMKELSRAIDTHERVLTLRRIAKRDSLLLSGLKLPEDHEREFSANR